MKWTSLSLIFLMLSCQSMNLLMPQYLPTNTHQQVEASQQLHQGITDIQYQTGWDKIPTSEQITRTLNDYTSPKTSNLCFQNQSIILNEKKLGEQSTAQEQVVPIPFKKPLSDNQARTSSQPANSTLSTEDKLRANFLRLGGDPIALEQTLCFLKTNEQKTFQAKEGHEVKINNKDYMVIQDFTKPSRLKRFYLLNRKTGEVEVMSSAQGMGKYSDGVSNDYFSAPTEFSNEPNTNLTPRGFMVSAERYESAQNWGWGMRFDGIQQDINDNSRRRAIVFHPGYMMSKKVKSVYPGKAHSSDEVVRLASSSNDPYIESGIEHGMTYGCTAVAPEYAEDVYDKTKGGALFYNYTHIEKEKGPSYCGENLL